MATYDPTIITTMANRIYATAAGIVAAYASLGAVLGLALGYTAGVMALHSDQVAVLAALVGGVLGGAMGFANGTKAALTLRFQAQQALVMMEIERNTRARTV